MRLMDSMQNVSRLVGNLGFSDLASNFLLEQRNLMRAQARENRPIRELIEDKVSFIKPINPGDNLIRKRSTSLNYTLLMSGLSNFLMYRSSMGSSTCA